MYKAGKHWLVAGIVTVAAITLGTTAALADTTTQGNTTTTSTKVTNSANTPIGSVQNANGKGQAVKNAQPQAQPVVQPTENTANEQQP